MTQQAFERMTQELLVATDALLKSELRLPGLLLLYAGIDIMASLAPREAEGAPAGGGFIEWTEEYLLQGGHLACGAEDLYAAGCGLLRPERPEAPESGEAEVKQVWYAWGTDRARDLQRMLDEEGQSQTVAVHTDELLAAFRRAVKLFERSLYDDPERAELVYQRAGKFLGNVAAPGRERRVGR